MLTCNRLTFLKMFMPRSEARSGTACRRRLVRDTFANVSVLRDFPSSLHFRLKSCSTGTRQSSLKPKTGPPERQRSNLSLVSVDQGRRGSHHGAAPRPGQWRNQGFRHTLGPLLQDLPQSLQVVHQGPVNALLCPVRLQQAPQDGHVKVGGIARSLGQRCWQTCRG